jgi:putative endonuclease
MFIVYAIESSAIKRIYIGHTEDIDERLKYHNSGYVKSTSQDRPWRLVVFEKVESKNEARWLERSLKKSRGKRKKWLCKNRIKE